MRTNDLWDVDVPYERQDGAAVPSSLEELLPSAAGHALSSRLGAARLANRAWREANGDRERAHTTGVALVAPRGNATDPRMVVYVDSNVLLSDFRTNTDLYLARLARWGIALSGLEFRLSRDSSLHYHHSAPPTALPPLAPDRAADLDKLVAKLPDGLRSHVRAAAESSLRRSQAK
jgi:hypothetical protein